MKQKTVQIDSLSIGYQSSSSHKKVVAQHINATLYNRELTCLLGANGIGKSTLLRTLSAFQPKIDGKISLLGKELESYSGKELSSLISVVLTDKIDVRNMTVRELVALGRTPYTGFFGSLNKEDDAVIDRSLSLVNITHLSRRMVHTLSDGEKQKTLIAKALAQETPIIFLDEPTAFLDFPSKVEMMQLLHELSRHTHKTIFLSTHDLELALQIADKIWLMNQGGITVGTPEDLSLDGTLAHSFSGKGLAFDLETGLFRIHTEIKKEAALIGEGQAYTMIRKALLRNGIRATKSTTNQEYVIEIINETTFSIYITATGETVKVNSVDELLGKIN
ncbi:ABC transporter ATP-binding protein [Bacteroides sp. 224]|uniref:ABC transporter ATP-binding protein n=1 Tax=Bacteroides sp. 224 TaxID=2302936 RepID=UPI0013D1190E|nr:ABC transporter ATP-binding protein [Bacteroides sp. 224]